METEIVMSELRNSLVRLSERKRMYEEQLHRAEQELEECKEKETLYQRVVLLLGLVRIGATELVMNLFNPLGKKALEEIFGKGAEFKTEFRITPKGNINARIITGIGDQLGNPLATDGNSVAQIVADAVLRPLVICLHRPSLSRILILDEPFGGLDTENVDYLASFLESLCDELKLQIIFTSHEISRAVDKYATVIELE